MLIIVQRKFAILHWVLSFALHLKDHLAHRNLKLAMFKNARIVVKLWIVKIKHVLSMTDLNLALVQTNVIFRQLKQYFRTARNSQLEKLVDAAIPIQSLMVFQLAYRDRHTIAILWQNMPQIPQIQNPSSKYNP